MNGARGWPGTAFLLSGKSLNSLRFRTQSLAPETPVEVLNTGWAPPRLKWEGLASLAKAKAQE